MRSEIESGVDYRHRVPLYVKIYVRGFPGGTVIKNLPANDGDTIGAD